MRTGVLNEVSDPDRARRRAVRAMLAVPTGGLAVFTVLYVGSGGLRDTWRGAWFVGCILCGPWTEAVLRAPYSWPYALLAWGVFLALTPLVRRTRIGDLHWSIHLVIVLAWMAIGLRAFGQIG